MRLVSMIIVTSALLALIGCSGSVDPNKRKAGKWKTDATLESLDLTGLPPGMESQIATMKTQMAAQLKAQGAREECLSAEAAAREDVSKGITDGFTQGGRCSFSRNNVGGGKIDVAGTCSANGQNLDVVLAGTMAPDKVDVVMTMKGAASAGPAMNMRMRVVSTHVGACS